MRRVFLRNILWACLHDASVIGVLAESAISQVVVLLFPMVSLKIIFYCNYIVLKLIHIMKYKPAVTQLKKQKKKNP